MDALAAPLQQGPYTTLSQAGPQLVAPLRFDLVILEDVYVRISWRDIGWRRQQHLPHAAQVARVATGQLASSCDFIGDIPQLYTQHRRLEGVEPAVTTPPDHFTAMLVAPVVAQLPQRPGRVVVIRNHRAAVPQGAEHLGRIEAEDARDPEGARHPSAEPRPEPLGAVLHDGEPVPFRERPNGIHVRGPPIELRGHDGARPRRDAALHVAGIGEQRAGIDVAEHRPPPALQDRRRGGEEGVPGHNDLGPRLDADREVRAVQRRSAAVHRQRVCRAAEGGEPLLEQSDRAIALGKRAHVAPGMGEDWQEVGQVDLTPSLAISRAHCRSTAVDRQGVGTHRRIPLTDRSVLVAAVCTRRRSRPS